MSWKRAAAVVLGLMVIGAGSGLAYLHFRKPLSAEPASIRIQSTPELLARGQYLFNLADCDGCHSFRDFTRFGGPVVEGGRGMGTQFPEEFGLPGRVVARNITPDPETGLGQWTDGEKIRAIREGISRDGRALFPMMPYEAYRSMSDQDVQALVAYLNSLRPVRNVLPVTELAFPASLLIKSVPRPAGSVPPAPGRSNRLDYGRYLANLSGCIECHTKAEKGNRVEGMEFGGGREFRFPAGIVLSANISPDAETGIGRWSEQQFLDKFYQYRDYVEKGSPKVGPESFTLMPWLNLCQLPPEDLGAIFAYLKTQKPVRNAVETHPGYPNKS